MSGNRKAILYPIVLLAAICCPDSGRHCFAQPSGELYVHASKDRLTIGNRYIERVIGIKGDVARTIALLNKLSGLTHPVRSDEFEITLVYEHLGYDHNRESPQALRVEDFQYQNHQIEELPNHAKRLTLNYALREDRLRRAWTGLKLDVVYELGPRDFYMRKSLKLTSELPGTYFLHSIATESFQMPGLVAKLGGLGQPVYGDDFFLGLEYPGGRNEAKGADVRLWHYVGKTLSPGGWTSWPAVLGVAEAGEVEGRFMAYVDAIRLRPVRPVVVFNTWYDMQKEKLTEANSLERIAELNKQLVRGRKIKLDSFVMDDGWDDLQSTWEIDSAKFPRGFDPLAESLRKIGSGLGIWFSPAGGYDENLKKRMATARKKGLEQTANGSWYCLAGPKYFEIFKRRLLETGRDSGINYFKIDGIPFECNDPAHGHPTGVYSSEANMAAVLDILKTLHEKSPEAVLCVTVGAWQSPWWLQYVDFMWMGGADYGYREEVPSFSKRDAALTYRDAMMYETLRTHRYQVPIPSLMTHGLIKGSYLMLGGANEPPGKWRDEVVMYTGRGSALKELYVSPSILTDAEWDSVAATFHWAETNQRTLFSGGQMILGDPGRGEVYGYAHFSPEKGIVTLRNPYVETRQVKIKLDGSIGMRDDAQEYLVRVSYPTQVFLEKTFRYGDTVQIGMEGYATKVLEVIAASSVHTPIVLGVPYKLSSSESGKTVFQLFPGNELQKAYLYAPLAGVSVHGARMIPQRPHFYELEFSGASTRPLSVLSGLGLPAKIRELKAPGERYAGTVEIEIPANYRNASIGILCEFDGPAKNIKAELRAGDEPLAISQESHASGNWYWFSAPLNPGPQHLRYQLQVPKGVTPQGKLRIWVMGDVNLDAVPLTVSFKMGSGKNAESSELKTLLPSEPDRKKVVSVIFEAPIGAGRKRHVVGRKR
jgi:hypothetical protein